MPHNSTPSSPAATPASAPRRRAAPLPPEERREQLIRATRDLVVARGCDVTTKDIAAAAEVGEGTIFTQFASKDELLAAVCDAELYEGGYLRDLAAIDAGLSLHDRLLAWGRIVTAEFTRVLEFLDRSRAILDRERLVPMTSEQERLWRGLFDQDAASLDVAGDDLRVMFEAYLSGLAWSARHGGHALAPETVVQVLLHGALAPAAGHPEPESTSSPLPTAPQDVIP